MNNIFDIYTDTSILYFKKNIFYNYSFKYFFNLMASVNQTSFFYQTRQRAIYSEVINPENS